MRRAIYRSSTQWLGRQNVLKPARRICLLSRVQTAQHALRPILFRRSFADASLASKQNEDAEEPYPTSIGESASTKRIRLEDMPSPRTSAATKSPKLAALHARLGLPSRFPLQTLARCLVDSSADPNSAFNNASLAILGDDILGYHTTEHVLCRYPRLPIAVIFAAQYAYIGPKALGTLAREWGIEPAAAPGGEVDPGVLQFTRVKPGAMQSAESTTTPAPKTGKLQENEYAEGGHGWRRREAEAKGWRRGLSSRIVYDDQFGELRSANSSTNSPVAREPVTLDQASQNFVRALVGAIYLHLGRPAAKKFFDAHILSRHLNFASLFDFHAPTIDLSRLCAREGFEPPVARLISETGRLSRSPVFVVGVYSGRDKLGEGVGASLDEARFKASAAALKSWYLYSPLDVTVPSETEGVPEGTKKWRPNVVDCGEVVS